MEAGELGRELTTQVALLNVEISADVDLASSLGIARLKRKNRVERQFPFSLSCLIERRVREENSPISLQHIPSHRRLRSIQRESSFLCARFRPRRARPSHDLSPRLRRRMARTRGCLGGTRRTIGISDAFRAGEVKSTRREDAYEPLLYSLPTRL